MKKCVIIGSGLGGLSCACILSKNGYQVTVLEQGNQIGGCLQCFRRGDAIFDTGMHYVGSADPGQTLHTMLRYLGIDSKINLSRLDSSGYDVISLNGEHYRLANGKDGFINNLVEHFPNSRDELNRYYDLFTLVAASQPMHSLNHEINLEINAKYQRLSVNDVIDSVITDPRLREVLAQVPGRHAVILGKPAAEQKSWIEGNICFYNHLKTEDFARVVGSARWVVSRGGYSTVMDMAVLGAQCIFVPTPGQYEQVVLARELSRKNYAVHIPTKEFGLQSLMQAMETRVALPKPPRENLLPLAVQEVLKKV